MQTPVMVSAAILLLFVTLESVHLLSVRRRPPELLSQPSWAVGMAAVGAIRLIAVMTLWGHSSLDIRLRTFLAIVLALMQAWYWWRYVQLSRRSVINQWGSSAYLAIWTVVRAAEVVAILLLVFG